MATDELDPARGFIQRHGVELLTPPELNPPEFLIDGQRASADALLALCHSERIPFGDVRNAMRKAAKG